MSQNLKQVSALISGVVYYRKFLRDLSKRIRLITVLLRERVTFEFTPAMQVTVCEFLAKFAAPPVLVVPD